MKDYLCKSCNRGFDKPANHFYADGISRRGLSPCCYSDFHDFSKKEWTEKEKRILWILIFIAIGGLTSHLIKLL